MSEVEEYRVAVKTMSFAQLQDELKRWHTQQSEATGEYGYWGGVTGQEIVDEEVKRRSGKEYIILKNFVDADGIYRRKETTIRENQLTSYMLPALEDYKFIKEQS